MVALFALARPAAAQDAGCEDFLSSAFFRAAPPERVLTCLLDGARVDMRDGEGNTPLHLAAAHAPDAAVTRTLLEAGADPALKNVGNRTPLHMAAEHSTDPAQVVTLAVWGAEVDEGTAANDCWVEACMTTPLHLAVRRPEAVEVVTALLAVGAAVDIYAGKDLADLDPELTEDQYLTPLQLAARHGDVASVVTLLRAGAGTNYTDEGRRQRTALHYAAARKNDARAIVKVLLEAGASADEQDSNGDTPLMLAAFHANDTLVFARLADAAETPCLENEKGVDALAYFDRNPALMREENSAYWALHDKCSA